MANKIKEVAVISAETIVDFEIDVDNFLKEGYELHGNIVIAPSTREGELFNSIVQLMVKRED